MNGNPVSALMTSVFRIADSFPGFADDSLPGELARMRLKRRLWRAFPGLENATYEAAINRAAANLLREPEEKSA